MAVEFFRPRRGRGASRGSFTPFSFYIQSRQLHKSKIRDRFLRFNFQTILLPFKKFIHFFEEKFFVKMVFIVMPKVFYYPNIRSKIGRLYFWTSSFIAVVFVSLFLRFRDNREQIPPFLADFSSLVSKEEILGSEIVLSQGETLFSALERVVKDPHGIAEAVNEFSRFLDLRSLRAGQKFTVSIGYMRSEESGRLCSIILERGWIDRVAVVRGKNGSFRGQHAKNWLRPEIHEISGTIKTSLYRDGLAVGVPANQLAKIFDIYSSIIDFARDLSPGDTFHFFYESQKDGWDRIASTGKIVAAKLTIRGNQRLAFRYDNAKGISRFYDDKGKGLRKGLLLMPVRVGVLTSGYGMRKNPVHGYSELHPALDFGARVGTPIMAAGDGVIAYRGWAPRGYGKYLKISHSSGHVTLYAHMSAFAKDIIKGKKVIQGETIGYVGSTGMSTGPHLHYEIHIGKRRVNPAVVVGSMTSRMKLTKSELEKFLRQIESYLLKFKDNDSIGINMGKVA